MWEPPGGGLQQSLRRGAACDSGDGLVPHSSFNGVRLKRGRVNVSFAFPVEEALGVRKNQD